MLPSMQTTTNRYLLETERDVAHVEYDVINYYTEENPKTNLNPNTGSDTASTAVPQQRCSRVNNNNCSNNTLLDVVVHSRSSHDSLKTEEDSITTPTDISESSNSTSPMRTKGGGNSSSWPRNKERNNTSSTPTLGVNMRVTGQCSQGGRKYMEDQFSVAYQESPLTHELEYAFFGIYDGHGGTEAALYAKEHLMLEIVKQKLFWSDNDEDVLRAIREGYIGTHFAMWREQDKWPRTANGHLSTAGTTATVAFMRREKIYIGHVGDSGIVLGYQQPGERRWRARQLTTDHKPESLAEKSRIQRSGGQVAIKSGVPRVVWNRPRDPLHRGPIKRRTIVDDIPFLAVARSLGDLWSYNSRSKEFVVSPDPDVKVVKINPNTFRCLIFGTDGLWNVVTPQEAVDSVREKHILGECLHEQDVMNPSKALVDRALKTWGNKKMRADNTSVVTVILTPASSAATTTAATAAVTSAAAAASSSDQEPSDTEINFSIGLEELEHEELNLELCGHIEEQDYLHDTPYSALAKRHLPPEPYRNFDYYIDEEEMLEEMDLEVEVDEEEDEQEEEDTDGDGDGEMDMDTVDANIVQQSKYWRKSLQQSIANCWQQASALRQRQHLEQAQVEQQSLLQRHLAETESNIDLYNASSNSNSCHSTELCALEQELEHSYHSYVDSGAVGASTEYSFAESYNTLLTAQQQQQSQRQQQQQQQQDHQQPAEQKEHQQLEHQRQRQRQQPAHEMPNGECSMQEILQEQQRYQQQEGYSLTQLETRSEKQQQQQQHQQAAQSNRWQQETYVEQPAELLALNALLQQERDEEQQVALERQQQQQQQQQQQEMLLAEASSSCSSGSSAICTSSSFANQSAIAYAPPWSEPDVNTLQDNEVSSTLPATPTVLLALRSSTMAEEQLQLGKIEPLSELQQQLPKMRRQMRRYRNVPNENHQHMQTRRRQLFKHSKSKSFISASAAAIVAYNSSSNNSISSSSNSGSIEALPNSGSSNSINNSSSGNRSRRRRSVNNGSTVMMTRRSHSLSLASGVSKRQLRSSICQLSNLDLTKRTLRTRNVPSAISSAGSSSSVSGSGNISNTSIINKNNSNSNNSSSSSGSGKSSHTFNKPATPAAATVAAATPGGSARRVRRTNEEREQRRSLRRSTLSASQLGSNNNISIGNSSINNSSSNNNASPFSKPTRLQSCNGGIAARPPPSPKKLNAAVPTLAIGTRAYTAALAAAADMGKRWSLRSSSNTSGKSNSNLGSNNNTMATLVSAISCYGARSRTATASTTTSTTTTSTAATSRRR